MKKSFPAVVSIASFFSLAVLVFAITACSSPPPAPKIVTVTKENNGQSLRLRHGDTLKISLEGNPTAGYSWTLLAASNTVLKEIGTFDFHPSTGAIGSPGFFTFTFQTIAQGNGRVELVYVRPADKEAPPAEAYSLNVQVE